MSSVDTAWLRMDRPSNLMMIVGVMIFDTPLPFENLEHVVESRLLRFRRFSQRAVVEATGVYWEDDPEFDLGAHLRRVALPGRADKDELQRMVADLIGTPLDPAKPLWQFQLVEHYEGGSALIVRIHHCIADGIALIGVLLSLADDSPIAADEQTGARQPGVPHEGADEFWLQIFQPMTEAMVGAIKFSGNLWTGYWNLMLNPQQIFDYAKMSASIATEVAALATMADDSPTRYKGKPGAAKRVAWSEPLPLAEIKAVGKVLGCSLNDILLSCVAGALRAYLVEHGDPVEDVELRALVPVNLRPAGQEQKLGNRFGLVALVLPVGIENPFARLYELRRRMQELKGSYQAALTLGILGFVGMCPKPVQQQILDMLARKATAVMTNVPGPQKPLYVAGSRLAQQMFWVPQSGDIGMGVSILSYNEFVQFGLVTDRRMVPDPEAVIGRFAPEFEKLVLAVLMEPWEGRRDPVLIEEEISAELRPKPGRTSRPARAPAASGRRHARTSAPETPVAARAETPVKPRVPKRFR